MMNNNLDFQKNNNGCTLTNTTPKKTALHNINAPTTTPDAAGNGNSYFNRFDNRIAANLAAVINASRFRSSSCGKPTTRCSAPAVNANKSTGFYKDSAPLNSGARRQSQYIGVRVGGSKPSSPQIKTLGRQRPAQLLTLSNFNCNDNEKVVQTSSSDDDNSPTELNNCKRLADKPPLVKRFTMGLLRSNEDSRPLVHNTNFSASSNSTSSTKITTNSIPKIINTETNNQIIYSNGYVNEESFEPDRFIASKFGASCRQSLTAIPMIESLNLNDNSEFNLKKRYLRETSSANSSPKVFSSRFRVSAMTNTQNGGSANNTNASEEEEVELKDAPWFQAGISREIALEVLMNKSPGAFLVRKSSSKSGCYALTLRVPSPPGPKIVNYIILRTSGGYKIKGFSKEFSSLKALITHHSVMPELLPVPLALPRPKDMTSSRRNLDDFDTYDSLQMLLKYLKAKNLENE